MAGGPGRPSEKKLSMLSNVRTALYEWIYRSVDKYPTLDACLVALPCNSDLRLLSEHLQTCLALRPALVIMFDDQTNMVDTLLQLQQPKREARWLCNLDEALAAQQEPADLVRLQFVHRLKKMIEIYKGDL